MGHDRVLHFQASICHNRTDAWNPNKTTFLSFLTPSTHLGTHVPNAKTARSPLATEANIFFPIANNNKNKHDSHALFATTVQLETTV